MKKLLMCVFFCFCLFILFTESAFSNQWGCIGLTGSGARPSNTALDGISVDDSRLDDGDIAFTVVSNVLYLHYYDETSSASESSPGTIVPNDRSSTGAWLIMDMTVGTLDFEDLTINRALITDGSGDIAVSDVTSTELGYLDGVTSLIQNQIDAKAPLASPTFTGTITIGSAEINETELENIDGNTSDSTQLSLLSIATGRIGTGEVVFNESPTLVTPILGDATATSITLDASADPAWIFRDSDSPGTDKECGTVESDHVSGGDGAENGSAALKAMRGGSEAIIVYGNFGTEDMTIGDTNLQPRIYFKTFDNSDQDYHGFVRYYTVDSGASTSFGQAMHIDTDGELIVADADAGDMPAIGLMTDTGTGSKRILLNGGICETDWNWTVGEPVYVSTDPTTTEGLTQTKPTGADKVQVVGVAQSADCIEVSMGGLVTTSTVTDYTADANCMGAWFMNSSSTETDRSGEGTTLTESSGDDMPTSATVPSGFGGNSRDFEAGDADYLYAADGGSTDINGADQPISICFWVKLESYSADQRFVEKYDTGQLQYRVRYDTSDGGIKFFLSSDGSAYTECTGATDIDDTDWHHICAVYDDTDMRVYFDGSLDSNGADNPKTYSAGIYNGSDQFTISSDSSPADGLIDEVIIFDRAISAAEVSDVMTNGIDGIKGGND